jgi:hypothetical protein
VKIISQVLQKALLVLSVSSSFTMATATSTSTSSTCPLANNLEKHYEDRMEELRTLLLAKIPTINSSSIAKENVADSAQALAFVEDCKVLDDQLAEFVVIAEATPHGLADFVQQQNDPETNAALLEDLLADKDLLKQMLLADGAAVKKQPGKNNKSNNIMCGGEAQYGPAMKIYTEIQGECKHASRHNKSGGGGGVLSRLALAISLEHAVPIPQVNASSCAKDEDDAFVDPVARYLNYEAAYMAGELDPDFDQLSVWDLRMVVNGDEPDEMAAWGRKTLRNFRPDHILNSAGGGGHEWRYVQLVRSDVRYGSQHVQFDRPELQKYQKYV